MAALPIIGIVGKVLDRVIPDKQKNDDAKNALQQMVVSGELQTILGQLEVDKAEAASPSRFVAGWRPFIGWICGVALAVDFIVRPFFIWGANLARRPTDFPTLDMTELMPLVIGMLGMAGAHAWESVQTGKEAKN